MTSNLSAVFRAQYLSAVEFMKQDKFVECVEEAEYNLDHPRLSRYWCCKNLILIASITEDWYKAERCRRKAEAIWQEAYALTTDPEERVMEALDELREGLDDLKVDQEAQERGDVDETYVWEDHEDEQVEVDEWDVAKTRVVVRLLYPDEECGEEYLFGRRTDMDRHVEAVRTAEEAEGLRRAEYEEKTNSIVKEAERREAAFAETERWVKAREEKERALRAEAGDL